MFTCNSMAHAHAVLRELVARFGAPDGAGARLVRSKNRFEEPSGGGWMDCLVNVEVDLPDGGGGPPGRYVCEVQIVHRQLLVVRTELGAHHGCTARAARARIGCRERVAACRLPVRGARRYNTYRAALELLECLGHAELGTRDRDARRLWALRQVLGACRGADDETLEAKATGDLAARQAWGMRKAGGRYPWPQLLGLDLGGHRVERVDVNARPAAASLLKTVRGVGGCGAPGDAHAFAEATGGRATLWSHVLAGHADWVRSACVSPDGALVVTASDDKTARVWSLADGALVRTLEGHAGGVTSACVSPDGALVVTASHDQTARVWSLADGALVRTLEGHASALTSACVSPDGALVVTASADRTARVYVAML